MESKQVLKLVLSFTLIFAILSVIPWYVTINRPVYFNREIHLQKESNLSQKIKNAIDGNSSGNKYFRSKTYTVTKTKSIIPYVYKDSTVTNVGYYYTN